MTTPQNNTDLSSILDEMTTKIGMMISPEEIESKAPIVSEIRRLKKEKNAVILGHNYMEPALYHTVPDFVGDSLALSRMAAKAEQETIVFCGVRFMAETAKILSPEKTVLLPAKVAGCSLASSITADDVRALRRRYPGVPVVSYVNTYADVKAETDVCCTSGNAAAVVASLDSDTVIFIPDEYLAKNVARETGKHIIFPSLDQSDGPQTGAKDSAEDSVFIGWRGKCEVHEQFAVSDIENARERVPGVVVLAHPECSPEVTAAADFAGSTSAMIEYVRSTSAPKYLLLTECAMGDNIKAAYPDKDLVPMCSVRCPHMSEITLEDTLLALQENRYVIEVEEEIRDKARLAVERMIAIG